MVDINRVDRRAGVEEQTRDLDIRREMQRKLTVAAAFVDGPRILP